MATARRKVKLVARFQWMLQTRILRARVPEFIALHPELDLAVEIPEPELGVTERVLKALAQGRREADILDLHTNHDVALAVKGSLREYFLDMTHLVGDVKNQFINWEPCTWGGRVYGLPSLLAGSAFFYRHDVFAELGIDPNTFETWDDFIRAGLEVKKAKGAYMTPLDTSAFNQFQPLSLQNGGGWFDASGNIILDQDSTIEALQLYHDLIRKYEIAWPAAKFYGAEVWQGYREGRIVGCYIPEWYGANEMPSNVPDLAGEFRIALAPAFHKAGSRSGYRGGMCAVVMKGPDEDIAFEFLRFSRLTLPAQIQLFEENFLAPIMPLAYSEPAIMDYEYGYLGGQKVGAVYSEIARQLAPFHVSEKLLEAQQIINSHVIPPVTSGKLSPKEALVEAAGTLRKSHITLGRALNLDSGVTAGWDSTPAH